MSGMGVNYGLNPQVRFMSPVRAGSRIRGHFKLPSYEPIDNGAQLGRQSSRSSSKVHPSPRASAESVSRRYL